MPNDFMEVLSTSYKKGTLFKLEALYFFQTMFIYVTVVPNRPNKFPFSSKRIFNEPF